MLVHPARDAVRRAALSAALAIGLAACGGVPMRTMAKLAMAGSDEFLGADPREVRVAINVDARVVALPGRVPVLDLVLERAAGEKRTWTIPLVPDPVSATSPGLREPRAGRHWLVWQLGEPGIRDFGEVQAALKSMQATKEPGGFAMTVRQDWIGAAWPALKDDRIETWIRTRRADGFYELWSGRVGEAAGKG